MADTGKTSSNAGNSNSNTTPATTATTALPSDLPPDVSLGGESATVIISHYGNKSNAIRALRKAGVPYADIARAIGVRYQHVRNVLEQPQKRLLKAQRENNNG